MSDLPQSQFNLPPGVSLRDVEGEGVDELEIGDDRVDQIDESAYCYACGKINSRCECWRADRDENR